MKPEAMSRGGFTQRKTITFVHSPEKTCLLSSPQQTACQRCKDIKGSGTEQGNQKESTAVIKMSHECAITGNQSSHAARPRESPPKQHGVVLMSQAKLLVSACDF